MRRALALGVALVSGTAAAEPVRKIVAAAPEGSPWGDGLVALARQIGERTAGRVKVRAVPGGLAGDEVETARMCAEGKLFGWAGSAGAFGRVLPELDALELPFLFDSQAEAEAALGGRPPASLVRAFERLGLTLVPYIGEVGWRSFAGKKALRALEDFRSLRVRSQESPIHLEMWRALGARPKAISVLETLSALQTGFVEAFDQSPVYMFATSWYQHGRVYTLSRHMYQPGIGVMCKGAHAALPAQDRRTVLDAMGRTMHDAVARARELEGQVLAQLAADGVQIVQVSPAERAALRQHTRGVIDTFRQGASPLGRELLEALLKTRGGRPK